MDPIHRYARHGVSDDKPGVFDMYVALLSSSGSALLWATYLGGSNDEECDALAVDTSDSSAT